MPAEQPGIMKILTRGSDLNKQRRYAGAESTFGVLYAAHLHQKKVVVISFRRRNLTPPRDTSPSVLQTPVFSFDMYVRHTVWSLLSRHTYEMAKAQF